MFVPMHDNPIQSKSFRLAKMIVRIYRLLKDQNEYDIARQILRSGTSIGANVEEAIGGYSKRDFLVKITIAYKEARETHYWLRLLMDCYQLEEKLLNEATRLSEEVLKILGSIQKTTKSNLES